MATHRCPKRGCPVAVPDHLFACLRHWFQIDPLVRNAIYATKNLPLSDPHRWEIVQQARESWGDIDREEDLEGRPVPDGEGQQEG
jgi:hypothetical protein